MTVHELREYLFKCSDDLTVEIDGVDISYIEERRNIINPEDSKVIIWSE